MLSLENQISEQADQQVSRHTPAQSRISKGLELEKQEADRAKELDRYRARNVTDKTFLGGVQTTLALPKTASLQLYPII